MTDLVMWLLIGGGIVCAAGLLWATIKMLN